MCETTFVNEIKISIRDFDLELQSACKWDYLSVQNSTFEVRFCGWLDTLQQITSYSSCSPNYLRTVNAKDNQQLCLLQTGTDVTLKATKSLRFVFRSDTVISKRGFKISLETLQTSNEGFDQTPVRAAPRAGYRVAAGRSVCHRNGAVMARSIVLTAATNTTCTENQFQCSNGSCIRLQLRCDGQTHCPFNEDETGCVTLSDGWSGGVAVQIGGEGHKLCFSQSMANGSTALCRQAGLRYATEVTAIKITEHTGKFASITDHGGNISFTSCESCDLDKTTLLACSDEGCGQKSNEYRKKRVIGGSVSAKGEWPWIVGLRIGSGNVICGGSIIGESWVLTAGHCVNDLAQNPQEVSIVSGVSDINDDSRQVRFASEIVIHPDYNFIYNADIALIRLQRPFTFTSDISTCGELYSYKTYIRDSMMCAGYTGGGIDACKGDSGSGLMCEVDNGRWTLAGVVSWGDMCGQTNRPGVYTSVTAFVDWIDEVTVDTQPTVNCTFEDGWCGYTDASSGDYFWTRQPADKFIKANEFLSCDFSDRNSCLFTESTDRNAVSWMLKSNDKNGNYIVAGGNKSTFGFMAISQLISPPLTSLFTGLPHCVHFKVNKFSNSTANLILATYVSIGDD
ncbi:ENTK-like protein [Mya arenaria]|uniref:ENTK-like protein n=1 Tax=Mya arenaria TaxID=6604 RepID=A0ABY7FQ19_MYAAR|nr:ENTK-like protein [Mya arenaria]